MDKTQNISKKQNTSNKETNNSLNNNENVNSNYYSINVDDVEKVKLYYEIKGDKKEFTSIESNSIEGDINPSKDKVVLFDSQNQKLLLVDISGKKSDITKMQYKSSSGNI